MKSIFFISFGLGILSLLFFVVPNANAEDVFNDVCAKAPSSTVCQSRTPAGQNPLYGPNGVITAAINLISIIVGIAALIGILLGGLKMITSGSNPQEVSKARSTIIYALIALAIVALAQVVVQFFLKGIG